MEKLLYDNLLSHIKDKFIIFLWSGGFESNFLLRFVLKHKLYLQCKLHIICVPFPQHVYGNSLSDVVNLFSSLPITFDFLEPVATMPPNIEYSEACPVCKSIRRQLIVTAVSSLLHDTTEQLIFMTGHNLDDIASYTIENIAYKLGNTVAQNSTRFLETSNKLFELFSYSDTIFFYRPLTTYSKNSLHIMGFQTEYDDLLNITTQQCIWINQRKRILQEYFNSMRIELTYDAVLDTFQKYFHIPSAAEYKSIPFDIYLL